MHRNSLRLGLCALGLAQVLLTACQGTGDEEDGGGTNQIPTGGCTTKKYWTGGDRESPLMRPGDTCIDCHTRKGEGPRFALAGTLYQGLKDVNDCNGFDGRSSGVTVVITDATNKQFTLNVNAAGNFYYEGKIATPYKAKVVTPDGEAEMVKAQTVGDCNSCHSSEGANDAPGRILGP